MPEQLTERVKDMNFENRTVETKGIRISVTEKGKI
jgi:hypothetical protein